MFRCCSYSLEFHIAHTRLVNAIEGFIAANSDSKNEVKLPHTRDDISVEG